MFLELRDGSVARYLDGEARYIDGRDVPITKPSLDPEQIRRIVNTLNAAQVGQVTQPQVTADQNNYALPESELVRLSTDASRTFTGFTPPRTGRFVLCNVGGFDVVVANNNAGSTDVNRVLCHTGANITLNPNESVTIIYDFASSRWRTVGFV